MSVQLSLDEVAAKYPDFPKPIMLKTDIHRRGLAYADAALTVFDPDTHQTAGAHMMGSRDGKIGKRPEGLIMRDGTTILGLSAALENNPYVVDLIDDKLFVTDRGNPLEEVFYWDKPDYFDRRTSSGTLMQNVVHARPQRLNVTPNRYCHFWTPKNGGGGCKYCDIVNHLKTQQKEIEMQTRIGLADLDETIEAALQEKGRHTAISLTSGSDYRGTEAFEKETETYINVLQTVGKHFSAPKFPSQLICTALSKQQLKRIYDNTGITSLTCDIELLNEELFNQICPGKAKWVGYKEWKKRLFDAVEIFGENRVNTGIVGGVELARPYGIESEDEALDMNLSEAEDFARHGVGVISMVWQQRPGSELGNYYNQTCVSLEYYVRLAAGLQRIRREHGLLTDFDDYRRCGNHPDTDLARVF